MIESGGDSDNNSILRSTLSMVKTTDVNSKLLGKVGITVGLDNKLSIDEETLKKADVGTLKTLFGGNGSYGSEIESKASSISRFANNAANSFSGYTAGGVYGTSAGTMYNEFY